MSGLDYSTFSISSALTPSQPAPARSYPADPNQQHAAEDVIDSHICNVQRDDLPSSSSTQLTDRPRERALTLSEPYLGQGPSSRTFVFPRLSHQNDPADDIQGSILCAQLGGFHFTPQYGGHGCGSIDEPVNAPTAITENSSWSSQHSLHYPALVRRSVSQCINDAGTIAEDARPGLTTLHCDVSTRIPARRTSVAITDRPFSRSYDFGLPSPLPSMDVDCGSFFPGEVISSPSPPPSAYHDDDFLGADCAHAFTYADQLPAMTRSRAHESASHYPFDRQTVQSLSGFQDAAHQRIISLDHRFAAAIATPFPPYSSSHSPHDHPICEPPSFSTATHPEELPRPGSAPPLIDNQVHFVGDPRAVLQSSAEYAASGDHVNRPHTWYPQAVAPSPGQSPRSSPRRAGSIGHNSQKTPPGSRHLRRWSSVTNPALRASPPFSSSFTPNIIPFPRYPAPPPHQAPCSSDNSFSHFSPCSESESDDLPAYAMPHAAAAVELTEAIPADQQPQQQLQQQQQPTPPIRSVIRCDGHLIDEESWTAALSRPDKLIHVYECFWDLAHSPCGMWIEGDQSSVADHLALFHGFRGGEVTTRCLWRDCPRPHMKGTSIARHVVTHIGFRVKCHTCKHEFARVDACNRAHSRSGCLGVGQPMYGDLQRVLDARKVDPLQRPSKKRRTDE
ncbi:hypothetical protein L210DRAFT_3510450 [Boletus edulis BED1]|uniref:Uncharacterized protein n=1 Tax=Boletus edulis BED1 TaxID=1328754 RepID=A0AAD4BDC2_BOLED|nr:hypothetical protein L210DRAFT_3510450 [Boletus edulis BED1]